jgi:hypothetical protein
MTRIDDLLEGELSLKKLKERDRLQVRIHRK